MTRKTKGTLYISGAAIVVVIVLLLIWLLSGNTTDARMPEPNLSGLTQPVSEQISGAYKTAVQKPNAANIGNLGMVYHANANYELAEKYYKLATEKGKSEWIWRYYLGYLYLEMGQSANVVENFEVVVKKNPDARLAWYYLGEAYQNIGKVDLAEKAFNQISGVKNKYAPTATARADNFALSTYALFQLSRILSETGRGDQAEKILMDAITQDRSFGPAYRQLGYLYNQKGDATKGKWYSDRAQDLIPFSPPVDTLIDRLVMISRSDRYLLKKIDEADINLYSEWALKLVNHGIRYLYDNDYMLSKAIKIYLWNGYADQATNLADRHIALFSNNFSELNKTGMLFFSSGIYPPAIKYLVKASALKPDDVDVKKNLAISYYAIGDKSESSKILRTAYSENKDNPHVLADINYLMSHMDLKQEALANLSRLKQVAPADPIVLKMSAELAEAGGNLEQAAKFYESSFEKDPKDIKTIAYFGNLLTRQKNWAKAINLYKEALESNPNEPELLERLGNIYLNCPDQSLRKPEEGKDYCERAFIHISSRPNILIPSGRNLAYYYVLVRDKSKALATIRQTINIARRANAPKPVQTDLEDFYSKIQAIPG